MALQSVFKFDAVELGKQVREKRGERTLRDIQDETMIPIATLSRIEKGHPTMDTHTFFLICTWIGKNPSVFIIDNGQDTNDPIATQFRAARNMSVETSTAFMELLRIVYEQVTGETEAGNQV